MDMKYDTRLNSSSVDAILVVFADLFTKKANKRKTFPCAVAKILLRANFAGVDTPGWISQSKQSIPICDGRAESLSLHL